MEHILVNYSTLKVTHKVTLVLQIKKALAQTIMAMAHHGYLDLEGGQLMIEFIVRQCSLMPEQAVS